MGKLLLGLPLWAIMVLIIGGLAVLAIALQAVIRRYFPEVMARKHNDVAGFIAAVIGVIYAVTVGFIIAEQWDNFTSAKDLTYREAFTLLSIAKGSIVLPPAQHQQFTDAVLTYNRAVIAGWPHGVRNATPTAARAAQTLDPLYVLMTQVKPVNDAQQAFVTETTTRLSDVSRDREERLHRASTAHLEWPLSLLVAFASAVVLVFCALFGLESRWLHYTMIVGLAMAVASNVLLVVLLNHPLSGPLRVDPDSYRSVVHDLS